MYSKIEALFCVILSWIIQIHCYNKVLYFTSGCSSYEIHDVSSSQTYDLVFRDIIPPERCKIGFYQGLDGEVCVEATSYDVRDCDIKLRFSVNPLKYYSCHDQPTTKECADYGDYLRITLLSTKLQFGSNKKSNSSFTLHITQGNLKLREDSSAPSVDLGSIVAPVVLSGIIFIVLMLCCIAYVKHKAVQRNPYMTSGSTTSQTPPVYHAAQQPETGSTVHPRVKQPVMQGYAPPSAYGYGPMQPQSYEPMVPHGFGPSTVHEYRSLPTDVHGQQIPQRYSPSLAHGQGHPSGQDHSVKKGQHPYTDHSAPPPSYEEAKNYYA